ncbi:hypothetical protein ACIBF1_20440 [Spirillospora sp. NPDC050679]
MTAMEWFVLVERSDMAGGGFRHRVDKAGYVAHDFRVSVAELMEVHEPDAPPVQA